MMAKTTKHPTHVVTARDILLDGTNTSGVCAVPSVIPIVRGDTMQITQEIAERLRKRREELKISQSEVARALRISQTTIQKIESGAVKYSDHVRPFWQYLGLAVTELSGEAPAVVHPN